MTEIENLEREIAEKQARLAELRAKEVDPLLAEAEAFASLYYLSGFYGDTKLSTAKDLALAALRRGIELAALPLAPVAGMSEEEIGRLALDIAGQTRWAGRSDIARLAIRETLRRAPKAWPSEAIEALQQIAHNNWKDQSRAKRVAKDALADIMGRVA